MTMLGWPSDGTFLDVVTGAMLFAAAVRHARAGRAEAHLNLPATRRPMRQLSLGAMSVLVGACVGIAMILLGLRPLLHPTLMLATVIGIVLFRPGRHRGRAGRGRATTARAPKPAPTNQGAANTGSRLTIASFTRIAALSADAAQPRISRLVHLLALRAGLDPRSADELRDAAMLYRIGRIAMPEPILRAPHSLAAADLALLRRKPEIGARILAGNQLPLLDCAAELSLCHQERWDGSGYPRGLLGVQIPISARIVALVATFDSLLSGATGAPWQPEQVVAHIDAASGRLFDPQLAGLFLQDLPSMLALREQP